MCDMHILVCTVAFFGHSSIMVVRMAGRSVSQFTTLVQNEISYQLDDGIKFASAFMDPEEEPLCLL